MRGGGGGEEGLANMSSEPELEVWLLTAAERRRRVRHVGTTIHQRVSLLPHLFRFFLFFFYFLD